MASGRQFKNLLVTGGCGFIGSNLIRFLFYKSGFRGKVINVDKLTYAGNPLSLSGLDEEFPAGTSLSGPTNCDLEALDKIFSRIRNRRGVPPRRRVARGQVDKKTPAEFIFTNIVGTFNLLETARARSPLALFHHVSTDEVYGSLGPGGLFKETTPYHPNSPYSASKASSDHLVRAYHETYGLPVTVSNCSNNYGPYQFPEKLIPLMILNASRATPAGIRRRQERQGLAVCRGPLQRHLDNNAKGEHGRDVQYRRQFRS